MDGIINSYDERIEKGHHRSEKRQVWCVPISQLPTLYNQDDWVGLKCVIMVVRVRHLWNKTTREVQFYLTSLDCDARKLNTALNGMEIDALTEEQERVVLLLPAGNLRRSLPGVDSLGFAFKARTSLALLGINTNSTRIPFLVVNNCTLTP